MKYILCCLMLFEFLALAMEDNNNVLPDLKKAFYIVIFKNASKSPLTFWCSDDERYIDLTNCLQSRSKIELFGCSNVFGCFGKIESEQDFYLLIDREANNIKFPIQLRMAARGHKYKSGFNDNYAHVKISLDESHNRKTVLLDYNEQQIRIDNQSVGKFFCRKADN